MSHSIIVIVLLNYVVPIAMHGLKFELGAQIEDSIQSLSENDEHLQ